jgi:hypothetical protein
MCAATTLSCRDDPRAYRGPGLQVASLPVADRVAVYRAAVAGSFHLDDPTLSILVDPTLLPRTAGLAGGAAVPAEVLAGLRESGLAKGTCVIPIKRTSQPLVCQADRAGYLVRFSDPFAIGRDSVQVNIVVEQYAIPYGNRAERLRFERAYQVAQQGTSWRAVREGRLPQP